MSISRSLTSPNGARTESGTESASALDRSRSKASSAQQAVIDGRRGLDDLDARIGRNTARTSADETKLRAALDEVKRLKKALKDGEKERQKLVLARKRAVADLEKAGERVRKAEAKYDRAVLADLIEREKVHDREAASSAPASATGAGPDAATLPVSLESAVPPVDGQTGTATTEPEDLALATARSTAARATAASAGEGAQPAPKPPTPRRTTTRTRTSRSGSPATPSPGTAQSSASPGSASPGSASPESASPESASPESAERPLLSAPLPSESAGSAESSSA
jgi:hypothetical protein